MWKTPQSKGKNHGSSKSKKQLHYDQIRVQEPNNKAIKLTIENEEDEKFPKNIAIAREQYLKL